MVLGLLPEGNQVVRRVGRDGGLFEGEGVGGCCVAAPVVEQPLDEMDCWGEEECVERGVDLW